MKMENNTFGPGYADAELAQLRAELAAMKGDVEAVAAMIEGAADQGGSIHYNVLGAWAAMLKRAALKEPAP